MSQVKKHEAPLVIEVYLDRLLEYGRPMCLDRNVQLQIGGLRLLKELFRARRSGRMTPAQEKKYEGLLKSVRPHIAAMTSDGLEIPTVMAAKIERVRAKQRRSARKRSGGSLQANGDDDTLDVEA
jgi:hypothetical protein